MAGTLTDPKQLGLQGWALRAMLSMGTWRKSRGLLAKMSHVSPQIKRWVYRANRKRGALMVLRGILIFSPIVGFLWTGHGALAVCASVGIVCLFVGWGAPRMRHQWVQTREYVADLERENGTHGLIMTAMAVETGRAVGDTNWMRELHQRAIDALPGMIPVRVQVRLPTWEWLFVLFFALWVVGATPVNPSQSPLSPELRQTLVEHQRRLDRLADELKRTDNASFSDVLTSLEQVSNTLEPVLDESTRGRTLLEAIEVAIESVESAEERIGVVAMAEILANLGEAAEYIGKEPLQSLEEDLRDAQKAQEAEPGKNTSENKPLDPSEDAEPPEPPEKTKPSEEPGEEGEQGEADEEVLARVQKEGEGDETEGSGQMPETLSDEETRGDGTIAAPPSTGGTVDSGEPIQAEGGAQVGDAAPVVKTEASEWIDAQWRGGADGLTRTIRMMDEGSADARKQQTVTQVYREIAESNVLLGKIPPSRSAYIRRYFDELASQEAP